MPRSQRTICMVTPEFLPEPGGTARAAARVARFAADAGHRVHVFAPLRPGPTPSQGSDGPTPRHLTVHRVLGGRDPDEALTRAISSVDRQVSFDLFHGFFFQMAHPCLRVARHAARPVIASFRGIDAHWLKNRLARPELEILSGASWITSVSTDALTAADAFVDISARSSFIPNSIQCPQRPSWQLTETNQGVVGTVCTFREKKDIPLLVQAFGRLPLSLQRKLRLVGDYLGPEAELVRMKTEQVVARHRLESKLEITGLLDHSRIQAELLAMNVFVAPSKHEGLPNALLEAAALGVPIVASAVDGTKDVFRNEESALLIPPGDPNALAAAIERVILEPTLAQKLSRGGYEVARSLTPEREREAWLSLYDRLTATSRQPLARVGR